MNKDRELYVHSSIGLDLTQSNYIVYLDKSTFVSDMITHSDSNTSERKIYINCEEWRNQPELKLYSKI